MLEHHLYLALLCIALVAVLAIIIVPNCWGMYKTRQHYNKLYQQKTEDLHPDFKEIVAGMIYRSQSNLVEEILKERNWETFVVKDEVRKAFKNALHCHVSNNIPFIDNGYIMQLEHVDHAPYEQLLEYYINNGEIPSLKIWYEDYQWRKKDHVFKLGRTLVQLDEETIELIKALDSAHRPVLIELKPLGKNYA